MSNPTPTLASGPELMGLMEDLQPLGRSLTGDGVRETLSRLSEVVPLEIREVPSGTRAFDWEVPLEWNLRDAWVKGPSGQKVIDLARSRLHVVGYSTPIHTTLTLEELKPHLHTHPSHRAWIPYRTAYEGTSWGFCLSQKLLEDLPEGRYEVLIDATLEPGSMSYGEAFLPGREEGEFLISTHVCHPTMANDNLSGLAVSAFLGRYLSEKETRYSYRLLFLPGTVGAITWLALNEDRLDTIRHGLVLSCLGDPGPLTYKRSRQPLTEINRAAALLLGGSMFSSRFRPFSPYGYDERQYCSPGFDLPVGCLSRTPWGEFPEYHTSADNLDLVQPDALEESLQALAGIVEVLEKDLKYLNSQPKGEPRLGPRGLWKTDPGRPGPNDLGMAILWVLNLSDGSHSLMDIAERSGLSFRLVLSAARELEEKGLLRPVEEAV